MFDCLRLCQNSTPKKVYAGQISPAPTTKPLDPRLQPSICRDFHASMFKALRLPPNN